MIFLMAWQRKAYRCQYDESGQIFVGGGDMLLVVGIMQMTWGDVILFFVFCFFFFGYL